MRNLYNIELGLEYAQEKIKHADINKTDKEYIKEYDQLQYIKGVGPYRRKKCLCVLLEIAKVFNKNFKKVTQDDIILYLEYLDGRDIKEITKADHKKILKAFYNSLFDGKQPRFIRDLSTKIMPDKEPEILADEELESLRSVKIKDENDKAFIELLTEGGCRISEYLNLGKPDVIFDKIGAILNVDGKTGARPVRIIRSAKFLKKAIKNMKGDYIFPKSVRYYEYLLKDVAEKAGIKKRVYPHLFRHVVTTNMRNAGVPDYIIRRQLGWSERSIMLSNYDHPTQEMVDKALIEFHKR